MRRHRSPNWRAACIAAALAALAGWTAGPASAAETARAQVVRDPETGQLRAPTAAEAAALRGQAGRQASAPAALPPQPIHHRDGSVEMPLDSSTVMFSVAQRQADGSIRRSCVQGEQQAVALGTAPQGFAQPLRPPAAPARTARGAVYELQ